MKIAFTYDLRDDYLKLGFTEEQSAEFDKPETIDAIESALRSLGFETDRVGNFQALLPRLVRGDRWDLVFNIAEGMYGVSRESQIPATLEAFQIPFVFSDPVVLGISLHKGMTKHVVRDLGIATPDFFVVSELADIDRQEKLPPFPLFAKPVAEGTSKGIDGRSRIGSRRELFEVCEELLAKFNQPALIEEYLPGKEFTVGILGTGMKAQAIGTLEVTLLAAAEGGSYSYLNKQDYEKRVHYSLERGPLALECQKLALEVWRGLGCRDGGRVDVRCNAQGAPEFIEVNPLPGLNPVHSDLPILCRLAGMSYQKLIAGIAESAIERIRKA